MFFKEWEILIVDDEPDIIQISRLAMRHFEVYGLPLRLHTAKSKAEALKVFGESPAAIMEATRKTFHGFHFIGDAPMESRSIQAGFFIGDQLLGGRGLSAEQAEALRQRLSTIQGKKLGDEGDTYAQDGNTLII